MSTDKRIREIYAITSKELMDFKLSVAGIKSTDTVVDLGCGDAEVLIKAHQQYDCKGIGLEILPDALALSKSRVVSAGLTEHIQILDKDLMTFDYAMGDVYILYLYRNLLGQLSLKFENELKSGSKIVTHDFDLPAWEAKECYQFTGPNGQLNEVFLYEK